MVAETNTHPELFYDEYAPGGRLEIEVPNQDVLTDLPTPWDNPRTIRTAGQLAILANRGVEVNDAA